MFPKILISSNSIEPSLFTAKSSHKSKIKCSKRFLLTLEIQTENENDRTAKICLKKGFNFIASSIYSIEEEVSRLRPVTSNMSNEMRKMSKELGFFRCLKRELELELRMVTRDSHLSVRRKFPQFEVEGNIGFFRMTIK